MARTFDPIRPAGLLANVVVKAAKLTKAEKQEIFVRMPSQPRLPPAPITLVFLAAAFAATALVPMKAGAEAAIYVCADKGKLTQLSYPLTHMAQRIASGQPVTIVALGSSSTAGAGASQPAASYPSRLEAELKAKFPEQKITVLNRGVNGEVAADMLARFTESVAAAHPDVVLWQVGTNAVLRDTPLGPVDRLVHDGIARIKAIGADAVLIDPQFAPQVLAKSDAVEIVDLISAAAKQAGVDLFPRFALMRGWRYQEAMPFEAFLSPDLLHMNDWSYDCLAKLLSSAMIEATTRLSSVQVGTVHPPVAGPAAP
jgi:acyl-CoA thioesterase I